MGYGAFPNFTLSNIKVKFNSWRVGAKVYPFRGALYVGVSVGKQKLDAELAEITNGTAVTYILAVESTIVVPHVGWRWVCESGFFWGMEVGAQFSASSTSNFRTDSPALEGQPDFEANKKDIEDKGKLFGQQAVPHFGLVQVGWFF